MTARVGSSQQPALIDNRGNCDLIIVEAVVLKVEVTVEIADEISYLVVAQVSLPYATVSE